jgi:hypothetical protein
MKLQWVLHDMFSPMVILHFILFRPSTKYDRRFKTIDERRLPWNEFSSRRSNRFTTGYLLGHVGWKRNGVRTGHFPMDSWLDLELSVAND